MKAKKEKSGSVKISPEAILEAKNICDSLGFRIYKYVDEAVKEKNKKFIKKVSNGN